MARFSLGFTKKRLYLQNGSENCNLMYMMKKFYLFAALLAGLWIAGCAPVNDNVTIVPYPNGIEPGRGYYKLGPDAIACDAGADEAIRRAVEEFAAQLTATSGMNIGVDYADYVQNPVTSGVRFVLDADLQPEAYKLEVNTRGIEVRASALGGFIYAIQSLKQLLPVEIYGTQKAADARWEVPAVKIDDAPRFGYRGMHLDVSRHFFPVDEVKRYIDMMVVHKLNTLHWHLTDDQGWRIEIKRFPRLTEVGSVRKGTMIGHQWDSSDGIPYGGYYTQDEIREVVSYAAERAVTVIPEIDLPGHMLAALTAYPHLGCTGGPYEVWGRWGVAEEVLCPGKEKTFDFIFGVLTEVMELFPSKYIHIGGDECPKARWEKCPHCQAKIKELGLKDDDKFKAEHYLQGYVTARVEKFVSEHGRRIIGWDEILEGELAPDATVMSWRGSEGGAAAAKLGHDVIMTPNTNFYFDYCQSLDKAAEPLGIGGYLPVKQVYDYDISLDGILTSEEQKHILGVQANLWTEYIATADHLHYMLLPRLAALSEVQWCNEGRRDWERFTKNFRMGDIYQKMGYNFAKHIYGVSGSYTTDPERQGVVVTLSTAGEAPIRYTTDGQEPTAQSPLYTEPVLLRESCTLKAKSDRGEIETPLWSAGFEFSKSTGHAAELKSSPTRKYTYGAPGSLVDGDYGGTDYTNGKWVGYLQEPFDAVIDMAGAGSYSTVDVVALSQKVEWIFPPSKIIIECSEDGENFTLAAEKKIEPEVAETPNGVKHYTVEIPATEARYLRVKALTVNPIPEWHGAAGQAGHLFIGEVAVK